MRYRTCVIVLIGEETADREWVKYEIRKAWNEKKGLFGIYIHNIKDPQTGTCRQGKNPFSQIRFDDGSLLSEVIKCYNPNPNDAYNDIKNHMEDWVETAISSR
jgi:hypothetical protein